MIPECTNLSVGYWSQHTIKETQDVGFAEKLLARLLQIDWEALPTSRDVTDNDYSFDDYNYYDRGAYDMLDLCEEHPVEVAEILEDYGVTVQELREQIDQKLDLITTPMANDHTVDHFRWYMPPWTTYK